MMHARALHFMFSGRESIEAPNAVHQQCFHVFFHTPTAPTVPTAPTNTSPVQSHHNTHTSLTGNDQPLQPPVLHCVPTPINPRMHASKCSLSTRSNHIHIFIIKKSPGHSLHSLTVHTESSTNNHRMHPQHMNTDNPSTRNVLNCLKIVLTAENKVFLNSSTTCLNV